MYTTFEPRPEHQGPALKPNFTGATKHLGFNEAADAIFSLGTDFSDSIKDIAPKAKHVWTSANLFAGINPEPLDPLTTARDGLATATAALELVVEVLSAIEALASLTVNVLSTIITQIIDILRSIANLFNPNIGANLLFIPPKIGKVNNPNLLRPEDPKKDPINLRLAKKSESAKESVINAINSIASFQPLILGDTAKAAVAASSLNSGGAYLQDTIIKKLNDTTDLARPCINEYSYWAGAGIFLGTNSINKLLDAWYRLNSILSSDLAYRRPNAPGLPPAPVIKDHKVSEEPALKCAASEASSVMLSPVQESIIVAPLFPTSGIYGNVEYNFEYRMVFISLNFLNLEAPPVNDFQPDTLEGSRIYNVLINELTEQETLNVYTNNNLYALADFNVFIEYRYSGILLKAHDSRAIPPNLIEDPEGGYVMLCAIDVYSFSSEEDGSNKQFLARPSEPTYAFIQGTSRIDTTIPKYVQYSIPTSKKDLYSPTGLTPKWISTNAVLHLMPAAIREVLNFFDLLETYLKTLLAEALAWIGRLIAELKAVLDFLLRLVAAIDRMIQLLQDLLSLTTSLGASVMTFNGNGPVTELEAMFKDYFALDTSAPASISKLTTSIAPREPIALTAEDLVAGKDDGSPGTVGEVIAEKQSYQRELQRAQRDNTEVKGEGGSNWSQQTFSGGGAFSSVGKTSPVFTEDATTCGLLIMGHSSSYGNLQALINFFKFIFGSEDRATEKTDAQRLKENDLETQQRNLFPADTSVTDSTVSNPIFKANMEVTDSPEESPFNYCP